MADFICLEDPTMTPPPPCCFCCQSPSWPFANRVREFLNRTGSRKIDRSLKPSPARDTGVCDLPPTPANGGDGSPRKLNRFLTPMTQITVRQVCPAFLGRCQSPFYLASQTERTLRLSRQ